MQNDTQLERIGNQNLAAIFGNAVAEQSVNDVLTGGIKTSEYLPTISLRGKDFRTVINGDETLIKDRFIDVILLTSRPNVSKTFYKNQYGGKDSQSKPDCAAADGIYPDSNIESPQAATCQVCPNNAWGSKITPSGKPGKACSDYKLIVVALAKNPDMVFQLRIPAASLKPLGTYVKKIQMMGVPADGAITRLSFADAEFPMLEFNMENTVQSAEQYAKIKELAERPDVLDTVQTRSNAPLQIQPKPVAPQPSYPITHPSVQPVVAQIPAVQIQEVQVETLEDTAPINSPAEASINDVLAKWKSSNK